MSLNKLKDDLLDALKQIEQLEQAQAHEATTDIHQVIQQTLQTLKQQGITQELAALQADISISTLKKLKADYLNSKVANLTKLLHVLGYDLCVVKR